jgi:hypothetical protein
VIARLNLKPARSKIWKCYFSRLGSFETTSSSSPSPQTFVWQKTENSQSAA